MPFFIQLTIANGYFTVDPILDIRSSSVLFLQSTPSVPALSVPALSSGMPTHHYPPSTTPTSLLPSSPACSDIEQSNSKLDAFIK